ncbi:N-acetyl-gamma-glutamyl-phosphate reductase, partial [hydrothermal vent metagenome]
MSKHKKIGLVGGRGFVGAELIALIEAHNALTLDFASSGSKSGQLIPGTEQSFITISPQEIQKYQHLDALVLALPNGAAKQWVTAVEQAALDICILDISADYRFDPAWVYGLPELNQ